MNYMEKRACLACGGHLSGRTDKKFCDDSCRTVHHNRLRQSEEISKRKTDSILRQNRKILLHLLNHQTKTRMDKRMLLSAGFRPDYLTRIASASDGSVIRCYYEFGLRRLSETELEIFLLPEYWIAGASPAFLSTNANTKAGSNLLGA